MTPANVQVYAWIAATLSLAMLACAVVAHVAFVIHSPRPVKVAIASMWALTFSQSPIWAGWLT